MIIFYVLFPILLSILFSSPSNLLETHGMWLCWWFISGPGILESEDKVEDNPDDEILTELKEKQQELRAVNQHNIAVTKHLLKMAKEEMARQELRKKLTAVEAEVLHLNECARS